MINLNHRIEAENTVLRNEIIRLKRKINHIINLTEHCEIDPFNLKSCDSYFLFELTERTKVKLYAHGFDTLFKIANIDINAFSELDGIGRKTVEEVNHMIDLYRCEE